MKRFVLDLAILLPVLLALTFGVVTRAADVHMSAHAQPFPPGRAGYYDTVWPNEHCDLWRSHAAFNAGLPANFNPERLTSSRMKRKR